MPPPGITFDVTALRAGPFGNAIVFLLLGDEGGPDYSSSVTGTTITTTVGTTGGDTTIDWAAIAALFNADSGVNGLAVMDGASGDNTGPASLGGGGFLEDGSYGLGLGQFYTGAAAPPPPAPCTSVMSMVTLVGNPTPSYAGQATPETADPVISQL